MKNCIYCHRIITNENLIICEICEKEDNEDFERRIEIRNHSLRHGNND